MHNVATQAPMHHPEFDLYVGPEQVLSRCIYRMQKKLFACAPPGST